MTINDESTTIWPGIMSQARTDAALAWHRESAKITRTVSYIVIRLPSVHSEQGKASC
jgi:hypothetical protein